MAASQSMAAMGVPPLVPCSMKRPLAEVIAAEERALGDDQHGAGFEVVEA